MSRIKRPTAKARAAEATPGCTIVETSSVKGTSLLIGLHSPSSDERVLYVSPYRADRAVYLMIKNHAGDCAVFTSRADDRRCDCGACLTYNAATHEWRPTFKRKLPGES